MTGLFEYREYKTLIRAFIRANHAVYGYQSKMAKAAGCQRSFLSQVLNGTVHLTPEHAVRIAGFWQLDAAGTDFFVTLVMLGRAGNEELRSYLSGRLDQIQV
jgi:transcriptional regulator with XRE-family HTH domain